MKTKTLHEIMGKNEENVWRFNARVNALQIDVSDIISTIVDSLMLDIIMLVISKQVLAN